MKWFECVGLISQSGKFKFKHHHLFDEPREINFYGNIQKISSDNLGWFFTEQCTLIARPIEDLTDEEIISYVESKGRKLKTPEEKGKAIWLGRQNLGKDKNNLTEFFFLISNGIWNGDPDGVEFRSQHTTKEVTG